MCASAWGYVHMSTARRVQQKHQIPLKPEVQAAPDVVLGIKLRASSRAASSL